VAESSKNHSVHKIVLPSGRKIEVVRFHGDVSQVESTPLHVCPDCDSHLVQPLSWSEVPQDRWELLLSCPNCEWFTEGVYTHAQLEDLEERLDQGLTEMLDDLHRLAQANMAEEIDRFVRAIHADQILPEDF
jgi:hypothetical protein